MKKLLSCLQQSRNQTQGSKPSQATNASRQQTWQHKAEDKAKE